MLLKTNVFLAEIIGTFALVFCGTGAIVINSITDGSVTHMGIAITFGAIVMSLIYSLGEVSGAHINPAVTIAFWIAGRFKASLVLPYIAAQTIGAFLASYTLLWLFPETATLGETLPHGAVMQSFILEFILTYLLMLVIIQVATGSKEQGLMAGIAIGTVVMLEALFAGPISGASMNPIRSLAPAVANGNTQHLWIYLTAPILGAVSSVFTWRLLKTNK